MSSLRTIFSRSIPGKVAYAAVHEFWYDPRYENPVTRGSDLEDFLFLAAGGAAAVVAYAI